MCRLFGPHNMEDGVFTKMGSRAIRSLVRTGKYLKMHQDMFLVVTPPVQEIYIQSAHYATKSTAN